MLFGTHARPVAAKDCRRTDHCESGGPKAKIEWLGAGVTSGECNAARTALSLTITLIFLLRVITTGEES